MKIIAAYLLAALGGNTTPSAEDIKSILESGYNLSLDYLLLWYKPEFMLAINIIVVWK